MSLDRQMSALARIPVFAALEPEALRLIAFAAEPVKFGAGDVVFRNGENAEGGFLVISGSIMLDPGHGSMDDGKIIGAGALIGELAMLTPTIQPATAIARENSTGLKISRSLVRRVLEAFPESAVRVRQILQRQIRDFGGELERMRQSI
jgi:CRP-like cAMP-binding protein